MEYSFSAEKILLVAVLIAGGVYLFFMVFLGLVGLFLTVRSGEFGNYVGKVTPVVCRFVCGFASCRHVDVG